MSDSINSPAPAATAPATADLADLADQFRRLPPPERPSLRKYAKTLNIPRSTLRYRLKRHQAIDLDQSTKDFFASKAGRLCLGRLVVALHLVFVLMGGCGLRLLVLFLRLGKLDRFVASSLGSCQQRQALLEEKVVEFAKTQRQDLAANMTPKEIMAALDETFHPDCLLVALDPDSGFLLVEQYAEGRSQQDWDKAIRENLEGLPVTVAACAGDQAKGLVAAVTNGLGVPHGPDLFHVQNNLCKPLSLPLAKQTKVAQEHLQQAQQTLKDTQAEQQQAATAPRGPGRPKDYDCKILRATVAVEAAEEEHLACVGRQERLKEAVCGLGEALHPVDLRSGQAQSACVVLKEMEERLGEVAEVASEAGRQQRGQEAVKKARGLLAAMVATVALFWGRVQEQAGRFGQGSWVWVEQLVCGCYLSKAASRTRDTEQRQQLLARGGEIVASARHQSGLAQADWQTAKAWAVGVCGWFCRSSSAVEGRNGQLRLHRTGLQRLSERKLGALTALHNYWLKRHDGSTAAGRFFGKEPPDLFAYLVAQLPPPASPAKQRKQAA